MRPSFGDERSLREVLVPLLLAAFVIVVSAFLVTVTLDMGQESSERAPATASVDFRAGEDSIHVTFTSMERPDTRLNVTVRNATSKEPIESVWLTSVGSSYSFEELHDRTTFEVIVVADWDDRQELISIESGTL